MIGMSSTDWLTLVLIGITGWYAWITRRILKANEAMVAAVQAQQHAAMRPYVQVTTSVRTGTNLIYLEVENVGKTAATDLTLSLNKDFYQLGERSDQNNLRKLPAFSNQIRSLAPGTKLRFLLGSGPSIFGGDIAACPRQFDVAAEYSTGIDRVAESSSIDLEPYFRTEPPTDPIVEELTELRKKLEELERIRRVLDRASAVD